MPALRSWLALAGAVLAPLLGAAEPAEPHAPAAAAPAVTRQNLLASERYWPYQVALIEPFEVEADPAKQPLAAGLRGVLIRVEESGRARIDFGRDGQHVVPVAVTDLLERANRIRRGDETKMAPNFALAIGTKLLEPGPGHPTSVGLLAAMQRPGFLCVFADPGAEGFAGVAATLAPLQDRHQVLTILFPQGEAPDAKLAERLRSLGWPVPFLQSFLAAAYTRTLLPAASPLPFVLLQTNEGRLILQGRWTPGMVEELRSAIDRSFGSAAAAPAG